MGLEEVEDVVGPLVGGLVGHAGLLQEVRLDVPARHPPHGVEPHADELALFVASFKRVNARLTEECCGHSRNLLRINLQNARSCRS